MDQHDTPQSNQNMSDLDTFEEKLQKVHPRAPENAELAEEDEDPRSAAKAGMELVGALAAGVIIGLALDHWLDTKPLFLLIFFFVGMITGFYNVYKLTHSGAHTIGYSRLHKQKKDCTKSALISKQDSKRTKKIETKMDNKTE